MANSGAPSTCFDMSAKIKDGRGPPAQAAFQARPPKLQEFLFLHHVARHTADFLHRPLAATHLRWHCDEQLTINFDQRATMLDKPQRVRLMVPVAI
jgi:hypothetical protein